MDFAERFELLEKIGTGSFATVYRARDQELGREVAVKQIHEQFLDDGEQLNRYWSEAQLLASLQHPNIVTIYDIDRERGWLIMELMQANLAERLQGRPMDLRALKTTIAHSLRALKYLHDQGVLHGDIKPTNLMVDHRKRVKLGDFGLARRVSDDEGSLLKGTTKYMAPEVLSDEWGEIGPGSDLYSVGFSAYELMCGSNFEQLFPGLGAFGRDKQIAWMMWHAAKDRTLPPVNRVLEGVPEDVAHVIDRLVEKDPKKRYSSASAALKDLKVEQKATGMTTTVMAPQEEPAEGGEDRKRVMIAGAAFALSLIMSLALLFWPSGDEPVPDDGNQVYIVSEVYLDTNEIKVEDLERTTAEKIKLGEKPSIRLTNTGRVILLEELRAGDVIEIETSEDRDGNPIRMIKASRPEQAEGRLVRINPVERTVVVAIESGSIREDLEARIITGCEILLNGEVSQQLDRLQKGDTVTVFHLPELEAETGRIISRIESRRAVQQVGFVVSVDAANSKLTWRVGEERKSGSTTKELAKDARITIDGASGKQLSLSDLRPGDRVRLQFDAVIREIVAYRDRRVSGVIKRVDPAQQMLLAMVEGKGEIELKVDANTEITIGLEPAALDDLRQDDAIEVGFRELGAGEHVAQIVDARRKERYDRWGIVLTMTQFSDSRIRWRPFARRDTDRLAGVLRKRYGIADNHLLLLSDRDSDDVVGSIDAFLDDVTRGSHLMVFVSAPGTGLVDDAGLAMKDCSLEDLAGTCVSLKWLIESVRECGAGQRVMVFDCSRQSNEGVFGEAPSDETLLEKVVTGNLPDDLLLIAGSSGQQPGLEWDDNESGVVGELVIRGYSGAADANRDARINNEELLNYLKREAATVTVDGKQPEISAVP